MRSWLRARRGSVFAIALVTSVLGCKTRSDEGAAPLPKASAAEDTKTKSDDGSAPLPKAGAADDSDAARPAVLSDTAYSLTLPRGWSLTPSSKPSIKAAASDDGDEITAVSIDLGPERFRYVAETRRQSAVHFGGEIDPLKEEVLGGIPAFTFRAKQLTELGREAGADAGDPPNIFCAVLRREGAASTIVSVTFYSRKNIEQLEKIGREILKQLRIR